MPASTCEFCGHSVPVSAERCPHCYRPGWYPNVRMAETPEERSALERRYVESVAEAAARGCESVVGEFEAAVANSSAVIARPLHDVEPLAEGDHLLPTYYQKLDGSARLPTQDGWHERRGMADQTLYGEGKKQVHFAALSLEASGLRSYGECSLVLRESMIEHRASVFEGNSTLFLEQSAYRLAPGHRASWPKRQKLCVAKLGREFTPLTTRDEFQSILVQQGRTTGEDGFVEVHIWGSLSALSFERALLRRGKSRTRAAEKVLREKFARFDVLFEVI